MIRRAAPLLACALAGTALSACGVSEMRAASLELRPPSAQLAPSQSVTFAAAVNGVLTTSVTWSVKEGAPGGDVSKDGRYTAPGGPGRFHVVVASALDPSRTAEAEILVETPGAGGGLFLDGMFLIGVYAPPPTDFARWKARGINTVVDVPDGDFPVADWDSTAKAQGLKQIRGPMTNGNNKATPTPAADIGNTSLLAWAHIDEPNNFCQTAVTPAAILAEFNAWKAIDPGRIVFTGFSGGDITDCPHTAQWTRDYASYLSGTEWIANDRYPVSGYWDNSWPSLDLTRMTDPMDQIAAWTDKPQFTYIESSRINQTAAARGVSPDQLRAEIWLAVAHGARGIIYFPELVGNNPFAFDGTTAAVATEMTKQNGILAALASVLQGPLDPAGLAATVPSPLHLTWRSAPSGKYFFVVNPTASAVSSASIVLGGAGGATSATVYGESRSVTLSGAVLVDDFPPYSVHIYEVP